jgi:hypothetical protein
VKNTTVAVPPRWIEVLSGERFVAQLVYQFSYLQVLDYLTTIAFLMLGIQEGNPLVRWAMDSAPSPFAGLAMVKIAALGLAFYCVKLGKLGLLSRVNILFAIVVAWNLVALILGAAALPGVNG